MIFGFSSSTHWCLCNKRCHSTVQPTGAMEFSQPMNSNWIPVSANERCTFQKCHSKIQYAFDLDWFSFAHHCLLYPNNSMYHWWPLFSIEIQLVRHLAMDFYKSTQTYFVKKKQKNSKRFLILNLKNLRIFRKICIKFGIHIDSFAFHWIFSKTLIRWIW